MFWNLIIGLISFGLNLILAPKPQNAKPSSLEDFNLPVAEEGLEIPEVFGTANLKAPNVTWYGKLRTRPIKGARRYGLFGPRQTVGYTYRISMQMVLCMGPVDELKEIWVQDKLAFDDGTTGGEFDVDASFDGQGGDNDVSGPVDFETGAPDQLQNEYLQEVFEETNIPAFRGVSSLVLKSVQIGNSTYMAPWEAKVQRIHLRPDGTEQWYDATAAIPRTGDGLFERIALPGTHQSNGAEKQTVDLANDRVVRLSSGTLQIFNALTGELIVTKSLAYTAIALIASSLTNEVIVWDNTANFHVYDLNTGSLKQDVDAPSAILGYDTYVLPGHIAEIEGTTYLMYALLIEIVSFKKVSDLWVLDFKQSRGFIVGGFPRNIIFNDEYIYEVHGNGAITIHPWNRTGIGSVLGTRFYPAFGSFSPPIGLGGGEVLPVYTALSYLENLDQMLLLVAGHIYRLSKDMSTQLDHIAAPNTTGPGIHPGYTVSNSLQTSDNRITFYSGGTTTTRDIYEYTIDPLALIEKYEPERWGMTGSEFYSSGFGIGSSTKNYILVSQAGAGSDTIFFLGADFDMNPAHIIRECITHRMGYLDDDIDDTVFTDAADVLYDERFGLTFTWSREEEIGEFINIVLAHIDAYLYTSRITGKFVLKLVRDDYDIDTIPVVDEDDIIEWMEIDRRDLPDAVNTVIVKYSNREHQGEDSDRGKDGSHQVDNIAQMQQMASAGVPDRVSITRHYPGISTGTLAARVGERDVKALGVGMASGRLRCKRTVEGLNPGDPFRLVSTLHNFEGEVMRVAEISVGDGRDNEVFIKFIQDVFALGEEGLVDDSTSDWENPASPPQPIEYRLVWESPYRQFVEYVGITQANSLISLDPEVGIIEATGLSSTDDILGMTLSTNLNGSAFIDDETSSPAPGGLLSSDIDEIETSIVLTDEEDLSSITIGSLAAIDSGDRDLMEIVKIDSVDTMTSTVTVSRGMSDTIPKSHSLGSSLIVYEGFSDTDGNTYTDDDEVGVKLISFNPFGTLDSGSAPMDVVTMDSRAIRPFRPANCTLNGQAFGTLDAELIDPIPAAWFNRNRETDLLTPLDWNDPSEAMETGQTVELRLLDIDLNQVFVYTGLTGTSQNIDPVDFGDRATGYVKFDSVRDGYTAWQTHVMKVLLPANLLTSGDMQSGTTDQIILSGDMGPDLLHLSGTLA